MTSSREHGFTLVELLVAITLASIIAGVVGEAVAIGLKTTTATATTFADASNARALTSHLLTDVQGAELIGTSAPPATICTTAPPETILWTKSPDPGGTVALYSVTRTPADAGTRTSAFSQLVREPCGGQPVTLAEWPGDDPVTNTPTVTCDGRLAQCGGESAPPTGGLPTGGLSATATQFDLPDVSAFPDPDNGTDPPQPYEITVGTEAMTVTNVSGNTLTVSRASGVPHDAGAIVDYRPVSVSIRVPRASSAVCTHNPCDPTSDDFNLTITPGSS